MKGKAKAVEFQNETYNIEVKGRHVLVTDAMKAYAVEKVSKIDRFSDRIIDVVITMDIQKDEHRVQIDIKVDHIRIRSHATTGDMYASVDLAVSKLTSQLTRYKKRIQDHQAKSVSMVDMNINVIRPSEDELSAINDEIEAANQDAMIGQYRHEVVSRKTRPLKTLTTEEAMMRIDLSGDNFLIYRSEEDNKLKVIYRRNDENLGIIEPEL